MISLLQWAQLILWILDYLIHMFKQLCLKRKTATLLLCSQGHHDMVKTMVVQIEYLN